MYDASKCNKNKHIKLLPKHEKYSLQLRSSDQKAIDAAAAAAASSLALSLRLHKLQLKQEHLHDTLRHEAKC